MRTPPHGISKNSHQKDKSLHSFLLNVEFCEISHDVLKDPNAIKPFREPNMPPNAFPQYILPGLTKKIIENLCKKICKKKKNNKWQTLLKKCQTYATPSEFYPRKINGKSQKVRVLKNFIDITVLHDTIISRCKSETKKTGSRQRAVYRVSIKFTLNQNIELNTIMKYSSCTCAAVGICKHIVATLWHCQDFSVSQTKEKKSKSKKMKTKFCQVLGEFKDPKSRKRMCIVRRHGLKFDSNLRVQMKKKVTNKEAILFHKELVYAARTHCAKRTYMCNQSYFSTR